MNKIRVFKLLSQAWLVLLLAAFYGAILAFLQTTLDPLIKANIRNETFSLIPLLVGNPSTYETTREFPITYENGRSLTVYQAVDTEGKNLGWVIPASALGFADRIQVLVGLDPDCKLITGIRVIDQKETPGLGDLIRNESFISQFEGKSTDETLTIVKRAPSSSHEVLSVTGATISSVTVADAVNQAVRDSRPHLLALTLP
jgi:Na+-translocating ferredoxin:NAD+ oxidoreductase subunit G